MSNTIMSKVIMSKTRVIMSFFFDIMTRTNMSNIFEQLCQIQLCWKSLCQKLESLCRISSYESVTFHWVVLGSWEYVHWTCGGQVPVKHAQPCIHFCQQFGGLTAYFAFIYAVWAPNLLTEVNTKLSMFNRNLTNTSPMNILPTSKNLSIRI